LSKFDVGKTCDDGEYSYILEVDLDYPKKLHKLHNDYPLAPEQITITYPDLSRYSKKAFCKTNKSKKYSSTKLSSTFFRREKYVVHIKNLKLYLELGMKLVKVHKVLKFTQKSFLNVFIRKCTEERQKSKSIFDKNLFKKINNSCYGKSIQNVRDYLKVKLHTNEKSLKKALSQHTFKSFSIIDENLVATSHLPNKILHNMPHAVGFTILEYVSIFLLLHIFSISIFVIVYTDDVIYIFKLLISEQAFYVRDILQNIASKVRERKPRTSVFGY
jgi:hypothetical protein